MINDGHHQFIKKEVDPLDPINLVDKGADTGEWQTEAIGTSGCQGMYMQKVERLAKGESPDAA